MWGKGGRGRGIRANFALQVAFSYGNNKTKNMFCDVKATVCFTFKFISKILVFMLCFFVTQVRTELNNKHAIQYCT